MPVRIERIPPVVYRTVPELAAEWGVSEARVKAVLAAGRVRGAHRRRKGKGRPWRVPAYWDGRKHAVIVSAALRGCQAPYAEQRPPF